MMSSPAPLRIGYVPEHYLLPLHLAKPNFPFPVELVSFPSGTGHMISSLRSDAIDLAIGLTEGWVAGLLTAEGQKARGYSIVGSWVRNPLRWAVVTGKNRNNIECIADLKTYGRVGVSRMGSGSHIMAFVLAQQEGWFANTESKKPLVLVPLGPFADLRDGVTGKDDEALADFFMWEHFTTKPYFDGDSTPLKRIGEIYTPWPSWHIAASSSTFPNPEKDERLTQVFETLDKGIKQFNSTPEEAVRLLGTGELGCHYTEEDAGEWLKGAEFVKSTKGVDSNVMESVVKVLQEAGVINSETTISKGDGIVGLAQ
jgi:hypothetical protein